MAQSIEIMPVHGPLNVTIRPPGSKSITNRALVCAALADGESVLTGALLSEDTEVMLECLRQLGIDVTTDLDNWEMRVRGCAGRLPSDGAELFVANSGTTIRFLTAVVATGNGKFRLFGIPRMRERPIGDLVDALSQLGADIQCESPGNCPPVVVRGNGLRGGHVSIRGDVSSQFLSGLLMAAPSAAGEVEIEVVGELVSRPYIDMTVDVMRKFGVDVEEQGSGCFKFHAGQVPHGCSFDIEPDASAASYFWAAAAICGGDVTVEGLSRDSTQGDVTFCDCLARMGCDVTYGESEITVRGGALHGIDVDMNEISDTAQTLAAVALFADGPTTIRGVAHIRHKETDRIGDLARELRRLGSEVQEFDDGLEIAGGGLHGAEIETYNDHRMAMSLALAGLKIPGVVIKNPQCTAKTYPKYFTDLRAVSAQP
jgi:3-phosphoshikimate 1-carboxyvinyltransferase